MTRPRSATPFSSTRMGRGSTGSARRSTRSLPTPRQHPPRLVLVHHNRLRLLAPPTPLLIPPPTATTMLRNPMCQGVGLRRLAVGVTSTAIRLTDLFEPRPETPTISIGTGTAGRASELHRFSELRYIGVCPLAVERTAPRG